MSIHDVSYKYDIPKPPDWFDLKNYENSYQADLNMWVKNLEERLDIAFHLNHLKLDPYAQGLINKCQSQGFFVSNSKNIYESVVEPVDNVKILTAEDKEQICSAKYTQKEIEIENLFKGRFFNDKLEEKSENDVFVYDSSIPKNTTTDFLFNQLAENNEEIYVSININAPINKLLDEFKKLVKLTKKKQNHTSDKNTFTPAKRYEWASSKIIPYFDLFVWSHIENKKITNPIYAHWLFPENKNDPTDNFRKTTKIKLKTLLNFKNIRFIAAQI